MAVTDTLLQADSHVAIWTVLTSVAAFGFWSESTRFGRAVSGAFFALGGGLVLSSLSIVPTTAPAYDVVWSYLVPMAIPLLLFKANLRSILEETGGILIAFILGAIGTVVGALAGFFLLSLDGDSAGITGALAASYIGGSMNFAAVAEALEVDRALLAAGTAADNAVGVFFLAGLALLPTVSFLRRWLPSPIINEAESRAASLEVVSQDVVPFKLLHISTALALSLAICALGKSAAEWLGMGRQYILIVTAITVIIANVFPRQLAMLQGHFELGLLVMYLFFVAVGAGADVGALMDSAAYISLLVLTIIVGHIVVILTFSRFFKLDLAEVVIASSACAFGPTSAAALAASKGWQALITPAVMLGVFGYVIANFIGVFLGEWLST